MNYLINIYKKHKPGFTLVELIITISILLIVLAGAFSIQAFGNNTFNNGSAKSSIQSDIRLIANILTEEIRYSSNVSILASMTSTPDPNLDYIYLDTDGLIKHYSNGTVNTIIGYPTGGVTNTLLFKAQDSQTVYFNIGESLKNQTFQMDTSVLLLNIGMRPIDGLSSGGAISYTSGQELVTDVNARPVKKITVTAPFTTVPISGGTVQLTADITPTDASIQTVKWSVNNSSLATISQTGLLTATTNQINSTIIVTASAQDGSWVSGAYTIITVAASSVKVNGFTLTSPYNYVYYKNSSLQMSITNVTPKNVANQTMNWFIDKTSSIATIDNSGKLTTVDASGDNTINVTAITTDGSNISETATINVLKIASVYINGGTSIARKDGRLQLTCNMTPMGTSISGPLSVQSSSGVRMVSWMVDNKKAAINSSTGLLTTPHGNSLKGNTLTITVTVTLLDGASFLDKYIINITD